MKSKGILVCVVAGLMIVGTSFLNTDAKGQGGGANSSFNAWIDAREGGEYDLCWQTKAGKVYTIEAADSLEGWQSLGGAPSFYGTAYEQRYHVLTVEEGGGGGGTPPGAGGNELVNVYVEVFADGKAFLTWNIQDAHYQYVEDTIDLQGMPVIALHEGDTYQYNLFTLETGEPTLRPGMAQKTYASLPAAQRVKADDLRTTYDSLYENIILAYAEGTYTPTPSGGGNQGAATAGGRNFYRVQETDTDTDGDGLFDHDEIYLTRTNPFTRFSEPGGGLDDFNADADGDGVSNGDELASGGDPLDYYDGEDLSGESSVRVLRLGRNYRHVVRAFVQFNPNNDPYAREQNKYYLTREDIEINREDIAGSAGNPVFHETLDLSDTGIRTGTFTDGGDGSLGGAQHTGYIVGASTRDILGCQNSWENVSRGEMFSRTACRNQLSAIGGCDRNNLPRENFSADNESGYTDHTDLSGSCSGFQSRTIKTKFTDEITWEEIFSRAENAARERRDSLPENLFSPTFVNASSPSSSLEVASRPIELGHLTEIHLQFTRYKIDWKPTTIPFRATWDRVFIPYQENSIRLDRNNPEYIESFEWVHDGSPDVTESPEFVEENSPEIPGFYSITNFKVEDDIEAGLRAHAPGRIGDPTPVIDRDARPSRRAWTKRTKNITLFSTEITTLTKLTVVLTMTIQLQEKQMMI